MTFVQQQQQQGLKIEFEFLEISNANHEQSWMIFVDEIIIIHTAFWLGHTRTNE